MSRNTVSDVAVDFYFVVETVNDCCDFCSCDGVLRCKAVTGFAALIVNVKICAKLVPDE